MSLLVLFLVYWTTSASSEEFDAMKGVDSPHVFFDMRDGVPMMASVHLQLIYETYKELSAQKKNPAFVVVFMGSSVKLISSNRTGFSLPEHTYLDEIAATISKMTQIGIHLEVCLAAVGYFGIDPATIQSGIKHVANGWISEIGYQAKGFHLVPVY